MGVFQPIFTASIAAGVALFFLGSPLVESLLLADIDNLNEIHNHNNKTQAIMDKLAFRQSLIVNSGNPVCSGPYYQGQLQDTAPAGTFVTRASAVDPNGLTLTWSIPDTSLQRFMINPITGDIFNARNLTNRRPSTSRMARSVIEFLVRATNTAGLTCDGLVRVNLITTPLPQVIVAIYNNTNGTTSPSFDSSTYSFTLTSCYPGARVGTVAASVSGSVGSFVQYYITQNGYGAASPPFGVSSFGDIFLAGSVSAGQTYTFTLQAQNSNGTGTAQVTVTTTCTNTGGGSGNVPFSPGTQAPTWASSSYTFGLGTCTPGSQVATLTAQNGPISYTINGNNNFAISQAGVLTVSGNVGQGTQSFVVGASNGGGTAYALVTINAQCNGQANTGSAPVYSNSVPTFGQAAYSVTITNCAVGATVGQLKATNANTYAIISGTRTYYGVNYAGNVTIVAEPPTGSVQSVTVQAINGVGAAFTTLSISANCQGDTSNVINTGPTMNAPASGSGFGQSSFVLNVGSCQPGQTIGTLTAGGSATFSIAAGGSGFSVNPTSGVVTITGSVSNTQAFLVQALVGGTASYATVTVNCGSGGSGQVSADTSSVSGGGVFPSPMNLGLGPQFSQSSYSFFPVACSAGVVVGSVAAVGGNVTYTSTGLPYWTVDPISGVVTSGTAVPNFNIFVVTAANNRGTSTATVTTTSNCPDYFTYTVTSCDPGTVVVPASAITGIAMGGVSAYTLSGPNSAMFQVNQATGQITATGPLTSGTWTYVLSATLPNRSYTAFITLLVQCGGTSVQFSQPEYSFQVCQTRVPTRVGILFARASSGESMTYSLGSVTSLFYIDPSSGELRTQGPLRTSARQRLTVSALSASGASTTANVNVVIGGSCSNSANGSG
ncbi:hypothetical protein BV898_13095 [Hypsibius exemplaris]|uniref:Cadherin domain-containing protein n=1 Tax=Hypsibius exemplaris TaxID=2072580 RepID=A0A1W0WBY7_HYPEX|nr:hypothetical protein BV898_13095 [Hypsibius exemplaris]